MWSTGPRYDPTDRRSRGKTGKPVEHCCEEKVECALPDTAKAHPLSVNAFGPDRILPRVFRAERRRVAVHPNFPRPLHPRFDQPAFLSFVRQNHKQSERRYHNPSDRSLAERPEDTVRKSRCDHPPGDCLQQRPTPGLDQPEDRNHTMRESAKDSKSK